MAGQRGGSLNLSLPQPSSPSEYPPISALFLIYFDIKAGYTIGWHRSLPDVELEGVVEYKSLPSGLHTVKEDLIYFVHGENAGVSAFVNAPAAEESRNARMIAVGVMVPLSYGRLGRAWKHAPRLKGLARELIVDPEQTKVLEDLWAEYRLTKTTVANTGTSVDSPSCVKSKLKQASSPTKQKGNSRARSASDAAALLFPEQSLCAFHPAWSLVDLLETFGPLIFPIFRAALLRKRILIIAQAPVAEGCNFVYDISVLSNIPFAVSDLVDSNGSPQRLRPLFSIGIHDIPLLEEDVRASKAAATTPGSLSHSMDERGCGWIACTTDSILAMKSTLYDVLITLPSPHSFQAGKEDTANLLPSPPNTPFVPTLSPPFGAIIIQDPSEIDTITEATSWSALAYSGFMWWASSGEQRVHSQEEADMDAALLSGLELPLTPSPRSQPRTAGSSNQHRTSVGERDQERAATTEMAIIAYFHRLTVQMLSTMGDTIAAVNEDDGHSDDGNDMQRLISGENGSVAKVEDQSQTVWIDSQELARMGLDVWSANDHAFVEELGMLYFGRRTGVRGRNVDICGIRVC